MKVHRATHIGGLDEEVVTAQAERGGMELVAEGGVHHVLSCKMELEGTLIMGLEIREDLLEMVGGLVEVGHDMGGEPDFFIAYLFHIIEEVETIGDIGRAIVHTWEDVAMDVGTPFEDTRTEQAMPEMETKHRLNGNVNENENYFYFESKCAKCRVNLEFQVSVVEQKLKKHLF